MATSTGRLGMIKPGYGDNADIAVLDADLDVADGEIGLPIIALSSPLPSVPYSGMIRRDKNDGYIKQWDSTSGAWIPLLAGPGASLQGAGGAYKQLTPPTVTGLTLGSGGSVEHRLTYIRLAANLIWWKYDLQLGVGGSLTSSLLLTLPTEFPIDTSGGQLYNVNDCIGNGSYALSSVSATRYSISAFMNDVTAPGKVFFVTGEAPGKTVATGASPFVAVAGSVLSCQGTYRTQAT